MRLKDVLRYFFALFSMIFLANLIVVYLWNLAFHSRGIFEWDTAFTFGISLGLALTFFEFQQRRGAKQLTK